MTKKICAFSTSDNTYAIKSAVSLLSVRKWQPEIELFIIGKWFSDETKAFLAKYDITPIEATYDAFHTSWDYPVECFYIFAGPELLHERGFDYSLYVDGDVYCNNDPLTFPLSTIKDFAGSFTQRNIEDLLKEDSSVAVKLFGNEKELATPRIQSGIVYFNNKSLAKRDFLKKVTNVYQTAIDNDIPRKGDDSLFALFKLAYPKWGYLDLGGAYNLLTHKWLSGSAKLIDHQNMINDAVFAHFTYHTKPWQNASQFPTYTYEFFYHRWRMHAIDTLDSDELKKYFPAINKVLTDKHLRFYWYPSANVGDLITPYYLSKVCKVQDLTPYSISEKQIKQVERNLITRERKDLALRIARKSNKLIQKIRRIPRKRAQYGVSTGSVIRLCGDHAMVFGSGIRSADQEVHRSIVRNVRGPLTRQRFLDNLFPCPPVYGDPGLLLPKYYKPKVRKKKYELGIIPHFTEYEEVSKQYKDDKNVLVIDMGGGDLEAVIDDIASCKKNVSSSLHGLVISHAYGVPVRHIEYSDKINGDGTKFIDYYRGIKLKKLPTVDAAGHKYISPTKLASLKFEVLKHFNDTRLQEAMFFDQNGFKKSARYPY